MDDATVIFKLFGYGIHLGQIVIGPGLLGVGIGQYGLTEQFFGLGVFSSGKGFFPFAKHEGALFLVHGIGLAGLRLLGIRVMNPNAPKRISIRPIIKMFFLGIKSPLY